MVDDKNIDFDCEYYLQKPAGEGFLSDDRRTTESIIFHLCTYYGVDREHRCNVNSCPKKQKKQPE